MPFFYETFFSENFHNFVADCFGQKRKIRSLLFGCMPRSRGPEGS